MSHTERPKGSLNATGNEAGKIRKHDFTLLGEWTAIWDRNDSWEDLDGNIWVIDALVPDNGYQRKARIFAFDQGSGVGE